MILGATIEATIYIVVVFLCLFDRFRTVVEETQNDSILDWWSMGAIVRSLHCAAELTHENKSAIHNCCTGKSVRSGAYYYRQLHPDILLEMDDLDKLTLKEYDDLCGIKRKYISTRKMAHIRQRAKDRQRVKIATFH